MKKIKLRQGVFTLIDDEDFDIVNLFHWCASKTRGNKFTGMAQITINGVKISMRIHRLIMNAPSDKQIDHINGDSLDNRKCNLRLCNNSQNNANKKPLKNRTSKYRGVSWSKHRRKWDVRVCKNNKQILGGYFKNEQEAALRYNELAVQIHGEFAYLNPLKELK